MSEERTNITEQSTPTVKPGHYNPVVVHFQEAWGAFFLGLMSVVLLIGWVRAERRYRSLLESQSDGV